MANRREFMRALSGVAALSVTTDVSRLGRMRWLRMATAMPEANPHDRLQPDWYRRKIVQVQAQMRKRKLNALVLLNATNVIYTTGYFHLPTERPLAALVVAVTTVMPAFQLPLRGQSEFHLRANAFANTPRHFGPHSIHVVP